MQNNTSLHDAFIKDTFTTIKGKILILSEEEVDQIFNNIGQSIDSLDKCDELYILEKLRNQFEDRRYYYYTRRQIRYDWEAFKIGIMLLIIIVILGCLLYEVNFHYNIVEKGVAFLRTSKDYKISFYHVLKGICQHIIVKGVALLFIGVVIVIMAVFCMVAEWFWPNDRKYYEKWSGMKAKVEKRILGLKQCAEKRR